LLASTLCVFGNRADVLFVVFAVQAGILQGDVDSLMVMDQWQASLMRALAQLQLKNSAKARSKVEQKFDMDDDEGEEELLDDDFDAAAKEQGGPPSGVDPPRS
jgi:molecular chaperone DnaK